MVEPEIKQKAFTRFEAIGEDQVRLWLKGDNPSSYDSRMTHGFAIEWLAKFDQDTRLRSEVSQAESLETARSAADAAWASAEAAREAAREAKTANTIATLALIAAVIAMALSTLTIFLRR